MNLQQKLILTLFVTVASSAACVSHASTTREQAMSSSNQVLGLLDGVLPPALPGLIEKIKARKVPITQAKLPIWILMLPEHKVLYYEGHEALNGAQASALVDSNGLAFGEKALDFGRNSRGGWLNLTFGKKKYSAYCASLYPFVACTLADPDSGS